MSNEYFDNSQNRVTNGTTARGADVNNIIDGVAAAFDLLPSPAAIRADTASVGVVSGTANGVVLSIGGATPIPYVDGQSVIWRQNEGDNTGPCTLSVDAGSPKPLVAYNGSTLIAGDLVQRRWYQARYASGDDEWRLVNDITTGALDSAANAAADSAAEALAYSTIAYEEKGYAEEWAQAAEDTPVSVAAGGDGSTDFSALHWAAKAADTVDGAIIKAATGAQAVYNSATGASDALGAEAGSLTISTGDSGVSTPDTDGDDLVIEAAAAGGISIATPNTARGSLLFADPEGSARGGVMYDHATDHLEFMSAGATRAWLDETGTLLVNADDTVFFNSTRENMGSGQATLMLLTGDVSDDRVSTVGLRFRADTANGIVGFDTGVFPDDILISPSADNSGADGMFMNSTNIVFGDHAADALGAEAGSVTISTGDSGVTNPSANADDLLIESGGNVGMILASPNTAIGQIRFADPEAGTAGAIKYDHGDDFLGFVSGGNDVARFDNIGRFLMSPGGTLTSLLGGESGSATISTGDSGVTLPNADYDDLLIESDGNTGITICSPNTGFAGIHFGDPQDANAGAINYSHSADAMTIKSVGSTYTAQMRLAGDTGNLILGSNSSDCLGAEEGSVTISTGDSGVTTPHSTADDLVIENDDDVGLSLLTVEGSSKQCRLAMGSSSNESAAGVRWFPDTAEFKIGGISPASNLSETILTYNNGVSGLTVETDGTLSVPAAITYESLVTDDDDIPNKKYVDDSRLFMMTAEESAPLDVLTGTVPGFQWSFGNGETCQFGPALPVACEVTHLTFSEVTNTSITATIQLAKNGAAIGTSAQIVLSGASSGVATLATPISFAAGDRLSFQTTAGTAQGNGGVVTALCRTT